MKKKKWYTPFLPKCSNFQITEFSPALEMDFESIFISGGYNQGGRGLDHFASEPFIYLCRISSSIYYLNDLLMMGPPNSNRCTFNLQLITATLGSHRRAKMWKSHYPMQRLQEDLLSQRLQEDLLISCSMLVPATVHYHQKRFGLYY